MLRVDSLSVNYGAIRALKDVSLRVAPGEIVALIGANGAGKSTLLKSISGIIPVRSGNIVFQGENITGWPSHRIVKVGIVQVPEGRRIFANLTVEENLLLGGVALRDRRLLKTTLEEAYDLFPRLRERRAQSGGTLSGGEQQMLSLARGLIARPRLLLLDEPSLGLAPKLVEQIFQRIADLRAQGLTILLVEQNAAAALKIADRAYVLETGATTINGPAADLLNSPAVKTAYLGV
ncbi:MAG TPA: ABC transporter ATP-binding protein [Candidatus Brocadiia bacterium]|nr:ABC transporter ATP-binding protein [Candidatus Brocadiia bacterium]